MATAEFPSNSHPGDPRIEEIQKLKTPQPVEEKTEEPPEKEVFEGKISVKRKKLGPRLKTMFMSEGQRFGDHLVENVIIPRIKDMALGIATQIVDNVKHGIEDALFGNSSSSNDVRTSRTSGPIPYDRMRQNSTTVRRSSVTPEYQRSTRQSNRVEDVVFEFRSDAQKALTYIQSQIEELGHCSLGDYYDYVEHPMVSTDDQWGWTNVDRARTSEIGPNEFLLVLPEPRPIHRR